jgi:hypothetical protein
MCYAPFNKGSEAIARGGDEELIPPQVAARPRPQARVLGGHGIALVIFVSISIAMGFLVRVMVDKVTSPDMVGVMNTHMERQVKKGEMKPSEYQEFQTDMSGIQDKAQGFIRKGSLGSVIYIVGLVFLFMKWTAGPLILLGGAGFKFLTGIFSWLDIVVIILSVVQISKWK